MHKGSSDFPGKQKLALGSQGNAEFSFLFTNSGDIDNSTAILRAYFGPNNYEFISLVLMVFVLWRIPGSCQPAAETSCYFILRPWTCLSEAEEDTVAPTWRNLS